MGNAASIGKAIRDDLSKTLRTVFSIAGQSVIDATPVDTEHDRSNWVLSVGSPYTGVDGSRIAVSYAAQKAGFQKLAAYDVGRDGKIFLRNNVFYTKFLDKGWSQQAPAGFVAAAFFQGVRGAPHGRKTSARKMLKGLARAAYQRGH